MQASASYGKCPSNHKWLKEAGIKYIIQVAHNSLLKHTPTGYSSDKLSHEWKFNQATFK